LQDPEVQNPVEVHLQKNELNAEIIDLKINFKSANKRAKSVPDRKPE
jgi:hypothetical protein